eukprot:TRINITY_DN4185_c1_g2_i2.p1 TRINITY_DN4185_c1_g2~~TRINITY_DN4185_c1_g2_i2.p1  ORF type:complete len:782 (+),score=89.08 TRINITY_DN4185_c1_g2_i2:78-2423(+)
MSHARARGGSSYCSYLEDEIRKTQQDNNWLREQIDSTRTDNQVLLAETASATPPPRSERVPSVVRQERTYSREPSRDYREREYDKRERYPEDIDSRSVVSFRSYKSGRSQRRREPSVDDWMSSVSYRSSRRPSPASYRRMPSVRVFNVTVRLIDDSGVETVKETRVSEDDKLSMLLKNHPSEWRDRSHNLVYTRGADRWSHVFANDSLRDLKIQRNDDITIQPEPVELETVEGTWEGSGGLLLTGDARVGGMLELSMSNRDLELMNGSIEWYCVGGQGRQIVDSNVLSYIPTIDDLNSRIQVELETDYRNTSTVSSPPIILLPSIHNAEIQGSPLVGSTLAVVYSISGGECDVELSWVRTAPSEQPVEITTSKTPSLLLTPDTEGCYIQCQITPVLKRGHVTGIAATARLDDIVVSNRPVVSGLELRCDSEKLTPGSVVVPVAEVTLKSSLDRTAEPVVKWGIENRSFEGKKFTITAEDVGKRLDCTYTAVSSSGQMSDIATAALFIPRIPLTNVFLKGSTIAGETLRCEVEGNPSVSCTWERSADASSWTPASSATSSISYTTSVDDVGQFIRCSAAGVHHVPAITYISLNAVLALDIARTIDSSGIKGYNVQVDGSKHHLILTNKYVKLLNAADKQKVLIKRRWGRDLNVSGVQDNPKAVTVSSEHGVFELTAKNEADRNGIMVWFRCFHAVGMPEMCREIFNEKVSFKDEARNLQAWGVVQNPYEVYVSMVANGVSDHSYVVPAIPDAARDTARAQLAKGCGWSQAWLTVTSLARGLS